MSQLKKPGDPHPHGTPAFWFVAGQASRAGALLAEAVKRILPVHCEIKMGMPDSSFTPEIYWYISRPKVEFLKGRGPRWSLEEISVGLKALWFEAGAKLHADAGLLHDLDKVKRALESNRQIPEFRSISPGNAPDIFSFQGEAGRVISRGGFWAAMAKGECALVLAGSATNAIGGGTAEDAFPFTGDPVGAVRTLFEGSPQDQWMLSKAWQIVMEGPFKAQSLARPRVEGLGVFAGMFTANKSEMAGTSFPDVQRIVVGSPIYIKQV